MVRFKINRDTGYWGHAPLTINGCTIKKNQEITIQLDHAPKNCLDCPFGEKNVGGKVPYICNLYRTSFCKEDAKYYCPLEKEGEQDAERV